MAVALYAYFDDANREYQVSLPDDFAVALSYQPASVLAPYLPAEISPRYLSYWAPQTNQYRAVVCPNRTTWINPPQDINVDGLDFELSGFYGEKFQQLPGGNLVVISGVQGEKGDTGPAASLAVSQQVLVNDVQLTPINTGKELARFDNLPVGTYMVFADIQFQTGAAAAEMTLVLGATGMTGFNLASKSVYGATASRFYPASLATKLTLNNATNSIIMYGQSTVNSAFARRNSDQGSAATGLTVIQAS